MTWSVRSARLLLLAVLLPVLLLAGLAAAPVADALPQGGNAPITTTPAKVAFGSAHVGRTVVRPVSVRIGAGVAVTIIGSLDGAPYDVQDVAAACYLPGPRTCSLKVTFSPTAIGAATGSLWFVACSTTSPGVCDYRLVPLTGTGTAPGRLAAATLDVGNVRVFASASRSLKLTLDPGWHFAGAGVEPSPGAAGQPPFTASQTCAPVTGGCAVSFGFAPVAPGRWTARGSVQVCNASALCVALPPLALRGTGTQIATRTTVASNFGAVSPFRDYVLTATVTPAPSTYLPVSADRGTVTFLDGRKVLCAGVPLGADGVATCGVTASVDDPLGPHRMTAAFSGNAAGKASTSAPVTVQYKFSPFG